MAEGKRSGKRSSKRPSRKQRYSSTPSGSSYTASSSGSETDRSRSPTRRKKAAAQPPAAPAAKGAPMQASCFSRKQPSSSCDGMLAPSAAQDFTSFLLPWCALNMSGSSRHTVAGICQTVI